jgi:Cytochrome oxidase complex assembly protein 1
MECRRDGAVVGAEFELRQRVAISNSRIFIDMSIQKKMLAYPLVVIVGLVLLLVFASNIKPFEQSHAFAPFATGVLIALAGAACWGLVRWLAGLKKTPRIVILCFLFVFLFLFGLATSLTNLRARSLGVYKLSMDDLRASDSAKRVLGDDLRAGWSLDIHYKEIGYEGSAVMSIPVSGNQAKGRLYIRGSKWANVWTVEELYLVPNGSSDRLEIKH